MKSPPTISLPQGVRDILPEEARKIALVESAILSVFEAHGFEKIITPLLEYVDVLTLGLGTSLRERVLKFIDPSTGQVVAIRPDITPQIARMVATRMKDAPLPLKLCYNESVLRYQGRRDGKSREVLQVGAEFISGEKSPEADAEMIVTAIEGLKAIGLSDFKIDIGDVGFIKVLLARLDLDARDTELIKEAVAIKDTSGLDAVLEALGSGVSDEDKRTLKNLTTFYGEEEVIEKASTMTADPDALASLANLAKILDIVAESGFKDYVTIDLGEVRGIDYYTGIIFEGFVAGVGKPILRGGRYDTLLDKYGSSHAAVGFAFDVEHLVAALDRFS
jgi:ATP phosphoribosyltransferase regulatory subunit